MTILSPTLKATLQEALLVDEINGNNVEFDRLTERHNIDRRHYQIRQIIKEMDGAYGVLMNGLNKRGRKKARLMPPGNRLYDLEVNGMKVSMKNYKSKYRSIVVLNTTRTQMMKKTKRNFSSVPDGIKSLNSMKGEEILELVGDKSSKDDIHYIIRQRGSWKYKIDSEFKTAILNKQYKAVEGKYNNQKMTGGNSITLRSTSTPARDLLHIKFSDSVVMSTKILRNV